MHNPGAPPVRLSVTTAGGGQFSKPTISDDGRHVSFGSDGKFVLFRTRPG